MNHHTDDRTPADLLPVVEQLRSNRPLATALELDDVKQRVRARMSAASAAGVRTRKGSPMKSRFAMLALLVGGMLFSGTGATLAVSGVSSSGSAGTAQYSGGNQPGDNGGTLPDNASGGNPAGTGDNPKGDVLDDNASGPGSGQEVSPVTNTVTRQVEAGATGGSSNSLPFTGFAAIPVLLIGVAMLAMGFTLRRRSVDQS